MKNHLLPAAVLSVLVHGVIFLPFFFSSGGGGGEPGRNGGGSVSVAFVGGDGFVDPDEHREIVEILIAQGDEQAFALLFPDVEARDIFGNLEFAPDTPKRKIPSAAPQAPSSVSGSGSVGSGGGTGGGAGDGSGSGSGAGDGFIRARLTHGPKPPYPVSAKRAGFEGRVVLEVRIAPDGAVSSASLLLSSGSSECDAAALETVRSSWRFSPALRNGAPSESTEKVLVMFRLEG